MLVHLSSVISLELTPSTATGLPAEAVKLACVILVILYAETVGVLASVAKVSATATSEQTVLV